MRIKKITFGSGQAWVSIYSDDDFYLGTWHVTNKQFVEALRLEMPTNIRLWKEE